MSESVFFSRLFDDLPEPERIQASSPQRKKQQRRFVVVVNDFALAYLLIHKFLIPLFNYYNAEITPPQGMQLDWWWGIHLALAFILRRKIWDDIILRVTTSALFSGSLTILFLEAQYFRWQTVSLWLTTLTSIAVGAVILTHSNYKNEKKNVALLILLFGIVLGIALAWVNHHSQFIIKKNDAVSVINISTEGIALLDLSTEHCGKKSFRLKISDLGHVKTVNEPIIELHPCGFKQSIIRLNSFEGFSLKNISNHYVNLKLNKLDHLNWRPILNQPLRVNQLQPVKEGFVDKDILFLFSDSHPDLGVLVILGPKANLTQILGENEGEAIFSQDIKKVILQK